MGLLDRNCGVKRVCNSIGANRSGLSEAHPFTHSSRCRQPCIQQGRKAIRGVRQSAQGALLECKDSAWSDRSAHMFDTERLTSSKSPSASMRACIALSGAWRRSMWLRERWDGRDACRIYHPPGRPGTRRSLDDLLLRMAISKCWVHA